jgi:hypothetical protein
LTNDGPVTIEINTHEMTIPPPTNRSKAAMKNAPAATALVAKPAESPSAVLGDDVQVDGLTPGLTQVNVSQPVFCAAEGAEQI